MAAERSWRRFGGQRVDYQVDYRIGLGGSRLRQLLKEKVQVPLNRPWYWQSSLSRRLGSRLASRLGRATIDNW